MKLHDSSKLCIKEVCIRRKKLEINFQNSQNSNIQNDNGSINDLFMHIRWKKTLPTSIKMFFLRYTENVIIVSCTRQTKYFMLKDNAKPKLASVSCIWKK